MPVPPTGHSSSIGSTSSYGSSNSSLLAPPLEPISSQSDIADLLMPRGDSSAHAIAASPAQAAFKENHKSSTASASQKLKRAWGKRRRPSQDATSLLSSGDEHSTSDSGPSTSSYSHTRPSATKLTMHLFGGRKVSQSISNEPPPLPPKPFPVRPPAALHVSANTANKLSTNAKASRPRSSIMATSPSINAAIQFMREDDERQRAVDQRREHQSPHRDGELEQQKEDWRKSDSTVASGHTVRPSHPPDSALSTTAKRRSTYSGPSNATGDLSLDIAVVAPALASDAAVDANAEKQIKRRSLSVNIHASPRQRSPSASSSAATPAYTPPPSSLRLMIPTTAERTLSRSPSPAPSPMRGTHSPSYSVSLTPASHDTPTLSRAAANGIMASSTPSGSPVNKTNMRGRLAAWTATTTLRGRSPSPLAALSTSSQSLSSPSTTSLNQTPHPSNFAISDTSYPTPDMQAIAAVREIRSRNRSPSIVSTAGATGIRQAATSLTSGAGAMALGFGKRAYEKVGRVWSGSGSGSGMGSGSDTPGHQSSVSADDARHPPHHLGHGPSAFQSHGRRTQNMPSGTWSVSSLGGGSRSSSERDASGRETPPGSGPGRLVRPPRAVGGGVVFGRELWECVRETRAAVPLSHPLSNRMIPALVLRCAQHLHRWGIQEEGLFRISGRSSHINRLRHEFDSGADYDIIDCSPSELDPHAVASVFKAYLRELPEPILTRMLGPLFDTAMNSESSRISSISPAVPIPRPGAVGGPGIPSGPRPIPTMRKPPSLSTFALPNSASLRTPSATLVEALGDLIARLPRENRDLLLTVVDLIQVTAARSKETKMPLSNLLLVFCPSLGMGPTLLRALCDAPGIWERALEPPVVDIVKSPAALRDEGEESDCSDSDLDSSYEDAQVVALPVGYKSAERDTPGEDHPRFEVETWVAAPSGGAEPPPRVESPVSLPLSRPRAVRRVPVPAVLLDEQRLDQLSSYSDRSFTPSQPTTEPLPLSVSPSASTPSLHVPSRSTTPLSAVSLTSTPAPESKALASPHRSRQHSLPFPASSRVSPSIRGASDHNNDPPASPLSVAHPEVGGGANSTPSLRVFTDTFPERASSRAVPTLPSSRSAPSVVFPSAKTPTTPTSSKKHVMTFSVSRQTKTSYADESPSPRRPVRRPSLNMLFNMKRSGSPQPRSRTPTISSPLSISSPLELQPANLSVESSPRTVTNPFPPVLTLPLEGSMDVGLGLGWDDVFGNSANELTAVAPSQPRQTAISQPSAPPQFETPPLPSRRPTTEFLLSSGGFFSANGPPLVLPSPVAVLEAANTGARAASSHHGETRANSDADPGSSQLQEDSSSGPDSPGVDSPTKDVFTPPPHLSFQLRRSSMEEDWATAVLLAAGKPTEPLA